MKHHHRNIGGLVADLAENVRTRGGRWKGVNERIQTTLTSSYRAMIDMDNNITQFAVITADKNLSLSNKQLTQSDVI